LYFSDFIVKFEDFLSGHIDRENFLSTLETVENDLLDMEEMAGESRKSTEAIVKSLEIIDDISILLEEEEQCSAELKVCLEKLTSLKSCFDTCEKPPPLCENKFFDKAKLSGSVGQLRFTEPSFDFHPHMKYKMPQVLSESFELSDIGLKTCPLYNLIEFAKNYIYSGETMTGFPELLKQTGRELCELSEDRDNSDNSFICFIEECIDKVNEIEDFMEEPDFMEELPDFIEELQKLNERFINFQTIPVQNETAMTEEKLIGELCGRVCQENFITSNYLLICNKIENFLNNETDEEDIKKIIDSIRETIISVREDYEKSYISPEEWTLEVYTGDKLLSEGLAEWEEGLALLRQCFTERNKAEIDKAISLVFEGNKKLVLNQCLAEYIDEQIMSGTIYSEKDFSEVVIVKSD